MRKVTLGLANSLDNFIARKNGGSDGFTGVNKSRRLAPGS